MEARLDKGPFYHGTKADLQVGDLLEAGKNSNYGKQAKANFVYFSATMDAAIWPKKFWGWNPGPWSFLLIMNGLIIILSLNGFSVN